MIIYIGELLGTIFFIYLALTITLIAFEKDKNNSIGRLFFISIGWSLAYMLPSLTFGDVSGPHLNPALTLALVLTGKFEMRFMYGYMIMQLVGTIIATLAFYLINLDKLNKLNDSEAQFNSFAVVPIHNNIVVNIVCEFLAAFAWSFGIFGIAQVYGIRTEIVYIFVFCIMLAIGLAFDFCAVAMNPFRDLIPRMFYLFLPMKNKKKLTLKEIAYVLVTFIIPFFGWYFGSKLYDILPWASAMKR